jgi:hypothetical protein
MRWEHVPPSRVDCEGTFVWGLCCLFVFFFRSCPPCLDPSPSLCLSYPPQFPTSRAISFSFPPRDATPSPPIFSSSYYVWSMPPIVSNCKTEELFSSKFGVLETTSPWIHIRKISRHTQKSIRYPNDTRIFHKNITRNAPSFPIPKPQLQPITHKRDIILLKVWCFGDWFK